MCVWFPVGIETAAVLGFLSSPSVPRPGGDAGEVVEVLRRARSSFFASLAGRGGEGRSGWSAAFRFWWWCGWWCSSLVFLLWPASVARGAVSAEDPVMLAVGLGVAASAGSWVVRGSLCCGRVRSSSPDSVAWRRMDAAAFYNAWWRLFPGGKRCGDGVVALPHDGDVYLAQGVVDAEGDATVRSLPAVSRRA